MTNCHSNHKKPSDICRGKLTDREYLEHMIPHHQVAIDISYMLQKTSKSPEMQEIQGNSKEIHSFQQKVLNFLRKLIVFSKKV